ncbi:MAG TPA: Chromate resistance protein ChrB, partial [Albitalea sp.]|nr:Chromate resistance protein ChrB [Albitalea sp.]
MVARDETAGWLLLVVSLPTHGATARMRVWRGLKALGCMALRDGAYLLPAAPERVDALRELGDECTSEGGVAWLMAVEPMSEDEALAWRQLFDRSEEYAQLRHAWKEAHRGLRALSATELTRLQRRLQREYDGVRSIDFFPGEASAEAEAAWIELSKRIEQLRSP